MKNKSKNTPRPAQHTIRLGEERKEKIERFRASKRLSGVVIPTLVDAVNILVDRGLEAESV